jgi:hypothetical protein
MIVLSFISRGGKLTGFFDVVEQVDDYFAVSILLWNAQNTSSLSPKSRRPAVVVEVGASPSLEARRPAVEVGGRSWLSGHPRGWLGAGQVGGGTAAAVAAVLAVLRARFLIPL